MYLIVGLGNPGPQYEHTPHNLGFLTIDRLAAAEGIRVSRPEGGALVGLGKLGGSEVALAKPLSYMNLSGGPVKTLLAKYGLEPGRLVLVYDELALPWSSLRIRERGSAGGHNGVESVIRSLGSNEFPRVRLGIGPGHKVTDGASYVLRPFRREELKDLDDFTGRAADAVRLLISDGAAKAMTVYNRRAEGLNNEEECESTS
jgi:PTH1 family peptidyl-tRNA hydrolase